MRRMWAAGAAIVMCLALGAPMVAQEASPAAAGPVPVTAKQACAITTPEGVETLTCTYTASDPRVTGLLTATIEEHVGVPDGDDYLQTFDAVLQGPKGTWTGRYWVILDWATMTAWPTSVMTGDGAYEGWTYIASGSDIGLDVNHDLVGVLYAGPPPPGIMVGPHTGTAFPTGRWTAQQDALWVLEFRSDGTWTATAGADLDSQEPISSGTYSTDMDTLTFLTDTYCMGLNAEQGTYAWTHANDQLTLVAQSDTCTDRVGAMDQGVVWTAAS